MKRVCRSRMSWAEKNELWQRWRRGESQSAIARALHRMSSCVHNVVAAEGGIAPCPRHRSRRSLSSQEREEISRRLAQGARGERQLHDRIGRMDRIEQSLRVAPNAPPATSPV